MVPEKWLTDAVLALNWPVVWAKLLNSRLYTTNVYKLPHNFRYVRKDDKEADAKTNRLRFRKSLKMLLIECNKVYLNNYVVILYWLPEQWSFRARGRMLWNFNRYWTYGGLTTLINDKAVGAKHSYFILHGNNIHIILIDTMSCRLHLVDIFKTRNVWT